MANQAFRRDARRMAKRLIRWELLIGMAGVGCERHLMLPGHP